MSKNFKEAALNYHRYPRPGKIKITPTKSLTTQQDLSLAYSPGVAAASELIHKDPSTVSELTARGNLVAVISDGTAVLGLGNIGPLAAKPVMEGKGVLFKKFADIDVFDIEINEQDPDRLIEIIASLEPTFGGINLEDIKAPGAFQIEAALKERLKIPVFHDDQHGTAIITAAAVINALMIVEKDIGEVKLAASGAGAAGMACLDLLVKLGMKKGNIAVADSRGVIFVGRETPMEPSKAAYARETEARTLAEIVDGADIFLGVSVGGMLTRDMVRTMAENPIILALSNPDPEILPEDAFEVRPDAIMATGRSDYPNQVNNVLCFPYIFRGALDVGATSINDEMKLACVNALADLTRMEVQQTGAITSQDDAISFGRDYIIPKPFDPRLLARVAPAVAQAAMDSGVATRPISDMGAYRARLDAFVFRTGLLMKPVFDAARSNPKRVVYSEGEEPVVLRAVQSVVDNGLAFPILIGRPDVISHRIEKYGLRIEPGRDFEIVNPLNDSRYKEYWTTYHSLMERRGISPDTAKTMVRTRMSLIAAIMVYRGEADALIAGVVGRYRKVLEHVVDVIGKRPGSDIVAALGAISTSEGAYFFCDTNVNSNPDAKELAEITLMAAEKVRMFGLQPKIALLSHSSFGSYQDKSARKMKKTLKILRERAPDLEVEGEMTAEMALNEEYRKHLFPNSRLTGQANLLVAPDLNSAHIAFGLAKIIGNGVGLGPLLLGAGRPAHVLTPGSTARRIMNMTAIAVVDAQAYAREREETSASTGGAG
jgi:malate dehydrogenase (oxaloacetate-decarboxylating)(NADP+)